MLTLPFPKSSPQVCSHVSFFLYTNNGGATRSSLVSGSLLVVEEDEDEKENDVDGKDKRVGGRVLTP